MQSESAIETSINVVNRAYELSLQAKNDTNSPEDRLIIAMEIKALREQIFNLANSRDSNGDYLFAGFKVTTQPFVKNADGNVNNAGDRGVHSIQTSDTRKSASGLDGQDVFISIKQKSQTTSA